MDRDTGLLGEKWNYTVDNVPYNQKRTLKTPVYRLELTRTIKDNKLEKDTEMFKHHGIIGSFNIKG